MHDLYTGGEENTHIKNADSLLIIQCAEMPCCYNWASIPQYKRKVEPPPLQGLKKPVIQMLHKMPSFSVSA